MFINSIIERLAYEHATENLLQKLGDRDNWFEIYKELKVYVANGDPDQLDIYEHWKDMLHRIDMQAQSYLSVMKTVVGSVNETKFSDALFANIPMDLHQALQTTCESEEHDDACLCDKRRIILGYDFETLAEAEKMLNAIAEDANHEEDLEERRELELLYAWLSEKIERQFLTEK